MLSEDEKRMMRDLTSRIKAFIAKRQEAKVRLIEKGEVEENLRKPVGEVDIVFNYATLGGDTRKSGPIVMTRKIREGGPTTLEYTPFTAYPIRPTPSVTTNGYGDYRDIAKTVLLKTFTRINGRPPGRSRKEHENKFHKFYDPPLSPRVNNPLLTKLMSRIVDTPPATNTTFSKETFPYESFLSPTAMRQTGKSTLLADLFTELYD